MGQSFYGILKAMAMNLRRLFGYIVILVLCAVLIVEAPSGQAKTVDELQQDLLAKQKTLQNAEQRIKDFQDKVQAKHQEAKTLNDQISILDDSVKELELKLEKTVNQIEETDLEIEAVQAKIKQKEDEIALQKDLLAQYIRSLDDIDKQSTVTVFLKYQTFSEAMNEAATVAELQGRAQETLVKIQKLHNELLTQERRLEDFKQSLSALKLRQQSQQATLESQRQSKAHLLDLTKSQESQYRDLLQEAQRTHQQAQAEISRLDQEIRRQLEAQGLNNLPSVGQLSWPIEPSFGISCGFHCAGYPYAYLIGPHTGIDIPTSVGTPIKAPADGYIGKLHDSGGRGYSYILLIHGGHVSTVFGHVSGFANVNEKQFVTRGTVIGYTGGAAGSHGSGLSSGPHLHFEVRLNDEPADPAKYLPSI